MNKIIVGIGEGKLAEGEQILVSYALGSCVGICLYDRAKLLAGMAHIVLPCKADSLNQENAYKFADEGVRELIHLMTSHGADKRRLTAKLAGGAKMFETNNSKWEIGSRNTETVKRVLKEEGVRVAGEDTGKNYGRTITFYAENGQMRVRTARHIEILL